MHARTLSFPFPSSISTSVSVPSRSDLVWCWFPVHCANVSVLPLGNMQCQIIRPVHLIHNRALCPDFFFGGEVAFAFVPTTWLAKMGGKGSLPFWDLLFESGRGGGRAKFGHFEQIQKMSIILDLFGRKSSHKSQNFLRSHLWRSRNSVLAVPYLMALKFKKSDLRKNHGYVSWKSDVRQSLDNSRRHYRVCHKSAPWLKTSWTQKTWRSSQFFGVDLNFSIKKELISKNLPRYIFFVDKDK